MNVGPAIEVILRFSFKKQAENHLFPGPAVLARLFPFCQFEPEGFLI